MVCYTNDAMYSHTAMIYFVRLNKLSLLAMPFQAQGHLEPAHVSAYPAEHSEARGMIDNMGGSKIWGPHFLGSPAGGLWLVPLGLCYGLLFPIRGN